jgi:DNA-binding MarR family transcriptional regulator
MSYQFEGALAGFINKHLDRRKGERRARLERGHNHAEMLFLKNVWFPMRGNFDNLHPEYEVLDWRGRSYFADFAWLSGGIKLIFEIKGFATHVREMDRQKYCYELNRETFLHSMGFYVISFAYDDVEQRPELCITLLRMIMSRYETSSSQASPTDIIDKEIIRYVIQLARPVRPIDIEKHLKLNHRTAVRILKRLCQKGLLTPVTGAQGERHVRYELTGAASRMLG